MLVMGQEIGHPLVYLSNYYPQLYLPIRQGMSSSDLYRTITQRGYSYRGDMVSFRLSPKDDLKFIETPFGSVPVLYLSEREDFEHFIQIMVHRCEPCEIPKSMGASLISGIINWKKIKEHKLEYERKGKTDWKDEFRRFTDDKSNYLDTIIAVGGGGYSALEYYETSYTKEEWEKISIDIRIYHEYTHFVCRNLYHDKRNAIWDEIVADCMGLICATGKYDVDLARRFLGIEKENYVKGRRLENYTKDDIESVMAEANRMIHTVAQSIHNCIQTKDNYTELLKLVYSSGKV